MDAFASPSIRASTPGWGVYRMAETLALTLAIGLSLVSMPFSPAASLDASWQEMLIHAHAQGMQFGRDIIFTWGPWGFLCSTYHLGRTGAAAILAWEVGGSFLLAFALVLLTRPLATWRRLVFACLFLAFHWFFLDARYFVLITLIGIAGLMRRDLPLIQLIVWTFVLGFLAQIKFTYFVISAAAVLASAALWAARGSLARALGAVLGYAAAVAAAWVAAGQNLANLPAYLVQSLVIAAGYGDAMGFDETTVIFLCGAAVALMSAGLAWQAWRTIPERPLALCASGFLAFTLFVMWKEGFTRADGHVLGFFVLIIALAPVLPGLLFPGRRWHWYDATILLCVFGISRVNPAFIPMVPRVTWERLSGNARAAARLGAIPAEWQGAYEESRREAARPAITAAVGGGSADAYNFNTAIVLMNGLRLEARPVFQSYTAYAPSLEASNLGFYQSPRAPDYLIWSDERVDDRYPGQDDAMIVAALPGHFEPLFPENGYWLLKRTSPLSPLPAERRLIFTYRVRLKDEVTLPPERDQALWLRADAVPDNLGRARALLYKPAQINIVTTDDRGLQKTWRFLPRVGRDGFLLVPTLADGEDLAMFLNGEAKSWVRSFHFDAPGEQGEFWSYVDVGLYGIASIPLRNSVGGGPLVDLGIFDRQAASIKSMAPTEIIDVPEGKALLLHAEGEAVFEIPAGAARFRCGYGIREGAYMGGGRTDGVEFEIDAVWASGRRERLWSRYLDPLFHPGDRGTQQLDVALPADSPARLILHTGAGPKNDNKWDWSYVSALHFDVPQASPHP